MNSLTKILAPVVAETQWTLPPEAWPKIEFLVAEDDATLLRDWLRAALVPGQLQDAAVRMPRMRRSDGSLFNAGHRFECTFNATHARGARHALNRQFDDGGFFLFFQR